MSKRKRPVRLVVRVADTHCGSTMGLCPPSVARVDGGEPIALSKVQEWIWRCWEDFTGWVAEVADGEPFALVFGDDGIEGVHHGTKQIISPDVSDHIAAFAEAHKPLTERAAVKFALRGTETHTGASFEAAMGAALGCERNTATGRHAFDRLYLTVHGCRCVFVHHMPTSSRIGLYATQLSVQLAEHQAAAARAGHEIPRVLCAAHRHTYGVYHDDRGLCVSGPPWQLKTRFANKVVPGACEAVGGYVLDWRGKAPGELPEVRGRVYRPEPDGGFSL